VRLRVGAVGGQISRNGVQLMLNAFDVMFQIRFYTIDLFGQYLLAFNNQVKLVLNGISEGVDVAGDHALDLSKVIFVHFYLPYRGPLSSFKKGAYSADRYG
jgi:hypothetical protein